MKIAIISDIHQSLHWRKIIDQKDDFDKIVFLGDEFDCWANTWPLQMHNAENIVAFKNENPGKVDLCWSNHAISYYLHEQCSGYQFEHVFEIFNFYQRYKELYSIVHVYDRWIISHAGVSEKWMQCCGIKGIHEINPLFNERPDFFRWVGPDGFGDNANEGPLWIRPSSLINNCVEGYNQAVGHTENEQPRTVKKNGRTFVFCDTHEHNYLTVLDTEGDFAEFFSYR